MVYCANNFLEVCGLKARNKLILLMVFFVRTKFRRDANKADNKAATVAVDSLINYEAVKVECRSHFQLPCSFFA